MHDYFMAQSQKPLHTRKQTENKEISMFGLIDAQGLTAKTIFTNTTCKQYSLPQKSCTTS